MPVIGPDYSRERADEAYNEIVALLESKYHKKSNNAIVRATGYDYILQDVLKDLIHQMFKSDAWNGW